MTKTCVRCNKPFESTSNVQKRCAVCMEEHKKEYQKVYHGPAKAGKPAKPAAPRHAVGPVLFGRELMEAASALSKAGFEISITAQKGGATVRLA